MDEKNYKPSQKPSTPNFKHINLLQSPSLYTSFFTPPTSPNDIHKFRSLYPTPPIPQFETPLKRYSDNFSQRKPLEYTNPSPNNQKFSYSSPNDNMNGGFQSSPKTSLNPYFESPMVQKRQTCNCRKSQCLKLYCECFSAGEICGASCACSSCKNNKNFQKDRSETIESILQRQPDAFNSKIEMKEHKRGCNCKKSNCQKKYCECLSKGVLCSNMCKCYDCKNIRKREKSDDEFEELARTIKKRKINQEGGERTIIRNLKPSFE